MYATIMGVRRHASCSSQEEPACTREDLAVNTSKAKMPPGCPRSPHRKERSTTASLIRWTRTSWPRTRCDTSARPSLPSQPTPWRSPAGAVELIDVEYEVLPPVLNQLDALDKDAPLVHPISVATTTSKRFSASTRYQHSQRDRIRKATSTWFPEPPGSSSVSTQTSVQQRPVGKPMSPSSSGSRRRGEHLDERAVPSRSRDLFCRAFNLPLNKSGVIPHVGGGSVARRDPPRALLACLCERQEGGQSSSMRAGRKSSVCCPAEAPTYKIKTGVAADGRSPPRS